MLKKLIKHLQALKGEEDVDFNYLYSNHSPLSSDLKKISLSMDPFPKDKLIENIINNMKNQKIILPSKILKLLVDFYDVNFKNSNGTNNSRAILQIIFIFSKLSAAELYKSNGNFRSESAAYNYFFVTLFNSLLCWKDDSVTVFEEEVLCQVKDFLKSDVLVESFLRCFGLLDVLVTESWIKETIDKMKIYSIDDMWQLRAVTLMDGILIATDKMNQPHSSVLLCRAYLFTLCAHETAHYLARFLHDDYNFSSPLKMDNETVSRRFDKVIEGKHLELGRAVELILFDDIQPDWDLRCSERAAAVFLERYSSRKMPPLIEKTEHEAMRLFDRPSVSLSFAGYWAYEFRL